MKKKKIVMILGLIMSATVWLSACSAGGASPSASTSGNSSTSAASNSGPKVKLRLLTWQADKTRGAWIAALNKALAPYNAEIDYNFVDNNNYDNIVNTQYAAGQGPDLLEMGGQFLGQQKSGYVADLTGQPWTGDFLQSYKDAYTVGGKIWAVPEGAMYAGIAYNTDIFKKYNIDVPKTWADLLTVGDRLKAAGFTGKPFITGAQDLGTPEWTMFGALNVTFYNTQSNRQFDEDFANVKGKVQDKWKAPLEQTWVPFLQKYYTADMVGLTTDQAQNEFALGNVAMAAGGGIGMGGLTGTLQKINANFHYAIMAYPSLDGSTGWAIGAPGTGLGANPKGKHLDLAMKAIAAAASNEVQLAGATGPDGVPAGPVGRKDLQNLPLATEGDQSFKDAMNAGNLYATWVKWPNAGQVLTDSTKALQNYMSGQGTFDAYLKSFDDSNAANQIK